MGKKRIVKKSGQSESTSAAKGKSFRKRNQITRGIVHINSTYNNTLITLTDELGNTYLTASCGRCGFSGSKKGTPYAASRAADALADEAREIGLTDIDIRIKGIGTGRESSLRVFGQKGFNIHSIKDMTPIPHGFVRPPKQRRV